MLNVVKHVDLMACTGEHLRYVNGKLHVLLLSLLFNAGISHGHVPKGFMDTRQVHLVKDKKGNLYEKRLLPTTCNWFMILLNNRHTRKMLILQPSCK